MNISKHAIILPVLITSAVSLHVISYYIEEPEEIVYNPPIQASTPIEQQSVIPAEKTSIIPDSGKTIIPVTSSEPNKDKKVEDSKEPVKVSSNQEKIKDTKKQEDIKQPAEIIKDISEENAPKSKEETIIKSKDFNEIIKEARINSGRIDPFLSVKPPKMDIVPSVPQDLINEKKTLLAIRIEQEKEKLNQNQIALSKKQENNNNNKQKISNNSKIKSPIKILKNSNTSKKIIVNDQNKQEEIFIEEANKISEGIKLTGIVTGTKPLAILSINDESKVLGIGDELVSKGDRIRVVSIDFNRKSILITDGYYKARLLIEEE